MTIHTLKQLENYVTVIYQSVSAVTEGVARKVELTNATRGLIDALRCEIDELEEP